MSNHDELVRMVAERGRLSERDARRAVNRCCAAMVGGTAVGWEVGGVLGGSISAPIGFAAAGPGALLGAIIGGYTALQSAPCAEVRDAVSYWLSQTGGTSATFGE